jgi:hypothetical protein
MNCRSSTSRPPDLRQGLDISLSRAIVALDEGRALTADVLRNEVRAELHSRLALISAALAPCGPERASAILARLAGMAMRVELSRATAAALARQDVEDLRDLPDFALSDAAQGFRRGEVGNPPWHPTVGELRQEALRRAEPYLRERARIRRVLGAKLLEAPKPATPAQRAAVLAGLKALGAKLAADKAA